MLMLDYVQNCIIYIVDEIDCHKLQRKKSTFAPGQLRCNDILCLFRYKKY